MIEEGVLGLAREGILLRREALAAGIDDDQLLRLRRDGMVEHLRYGQYAVGSSGGRPTRGRGTSCGPSPS